jgi:hypothetical protein
MTDRNSKAALLQEIWSLTADAVYKALTSGEPISAAMLGECRRFLETNDVSLQTLHHLRSQSIGFADLPTFSDDPADDTDSSSDSEGDHLKVVTPFRK